MKTFKNNKWNWVFVALVVGTLVYFLIDRLPSSSNVPSSQKAAKTEAPKGATGPGPSAGATAAPAPTSTHSQKDVENMMKAQKYTPSTGDISPEGFNWIHRDLALVYSRAIYEHNLDGRFHEGKLKKKRGELLKYIQSLRAIPKSAFQQWPEVHRASFLHNAYHAHILLFLIDTSFAEHTNKQMDKKNTVDLFGNKYSFSQYIKQELESEYNDPRIYMSLYCFEKRCPEFRNRIVNGKNFDQMLKVSATRFFLHEEKNFVKDGKVDLSPHVSKYRKHFPKDDAEFKKYISNLLPGSSDLKKKL